MKSELSIIVPCYNYARYLRTSVDSILNQDYPHYELILIDDGSSDETWKIMQEYDAEYPQVRAFKNETNQGIFKVNEQGWEVAKGNYLHFFSADDYYHPSCLSKVMKMFKENPELGLVCTDMGYFKDGEEKITFKKLLDACESPALFSKDEIVEVMKKYRFQIPGLTCVVKQETLKKHQHLDPYLENISDWFCFNKIALLEGVGYIPETLISMRLHEETYTSRVKRDKKRRRATYYYLLKKLSKERELKRRFKRAGLLDFIYRELGWKLLFKLK